MPRFATVYMTYENTVVNPSFETPLLTQNNLSIDKTSVTLKQLLKIPLPQTSDFKNYLEFLEHKDNWLKQCVQVLLDEHSQEVKPFIYANSAVQLANKNPTKLTNLYWQLIVKFNMSPYGIIKTMPELLKTNDETCTNYSVTSSLNNIETRNQLWGMQRMGQSQTVLEDGRTILIGGEYEDYYDPHFCIYNDVIVIHPNGNIDVFGYPLSVFPCTDFHSATLVGDEIWLIGSMGYQAEREFSQTQVYKLNIHSYKISKVETVNSMGWINSHQAVYRDGQIIVSGGRIIEQGVMPMYENKDDWALNLKTLIWTNLTNKPWHCFFVSRSDSHFLNLDEYKALAHSFLLNKTDYEQKYQDLASSIGIYPDLVLYDSLFIPPIAHSLDDGHLKYNEQAVIIDEVRVRYVDEGQSIQVYIEGDLPEKSIQLIKSNLKHKLEKLENAPCQVVDF